MFRVNRRDACHLGKSPTSSREDRTTFFSFQHALLHERRFCTINSMLFLNQHIARPLEFAWKAQKYVYLCCTTSKWSVKAAWNFIHPSPSPPPPSITASPTVDLRLKWIGQNKRDFSFLVPTISKISRNMWKWHRFQTENGANKAHFPFPERKHFAWIYLLNIYWAHTAEITHEIVPLYLHSHRTLK